jgi:hypothetical protein
MAALLLVADRMMTASSLSDNPVAGGPVARHDPIFALSSGLQVWPKQKPEREN